MPTTSHLTCTVWGPMYVIISLAHSCVKSIYYHLTNYPLPSPVRSIGTGPADPASARIKFPVQLAIAT